MPEKDIYIKFHGSMSHRWIPKASTGFALNVFLLKGLNIENFSIENQWKHLTNKLPFQNKELQNIDHKKIVEAEVVDWGDCKRNGGSLFSIGKSQRWKSWLVL